MTSTLFFSLEKKTGLRTGTELSYSYLLPPIFWVGLQGINILLLFL